MTILLAQSEGHAVLIPEWVKDIATFRKWACSDAFPETGHYSHLNGSLWVDASMERVLHNDIKTEFTVTLGGLARASNLGKFHADGMLLTNEAAALSSEPDGMYVSFVSLKAGNLTFVDELQSREGVGFPDMVLEVVSPTSRQKDTVILRDLYHRAGIIEYWLVEPSRWGDKVEFQILQWAQESYVQAESRGGWIDSAVFGRSFLLEQGINPLGKPQFRLQAR